MDRYARRVFSLGCSLVVALAVGCAGDDGEGDDAGAPKIAEFEEECTQIFSCDCEDHGWAEVESCAETFAVYYAGIEGAAAAAALNVDLACFKSALPHAFFGCLTPSEFNILDLECSVCQYAYGDKAKGETCVDYAWGMSDCAQGLWCAGGGKDSTCSDPCEKKALGESCESPGECTGGHYCDWEAGVCRAFVGEGASCAERRCAEGLYCDWDTEICMVPGGLGEPCDGPCAGDLLCSWETGTCVNPPGLGEDCIEGSCASGFQCDWDTFTCVSRPGLGEPCTELCAAPFICDYWEAICVIEEPLICY